MNKFKKFLSIMLCSSMVFSNVGTVQAAETTEAEEYSIYPIVRDINYDGTAFTMDKQVNVVYETGIDTATRSYLKEVLADNGVTVSEVSEAAEGEWNILLGVDGSEEEADLYENTLTVETEALYDQFDGYLLEAKDQQITIVGGDSDAVFRGVATLKMMLSSFDGLKLLGAQIEDYAGIEYRGFIEGFYGGWDYETRESLMNFARDVKMNMYVYASKTDVYHTTQWNALYPDSQIKEIENLVKIGQETKCYYVWSVHLGSFFTGISIAGNPDTYEARYEQLVAKLTQLYNAGVRKFDILNDDFGGGSHADVVTLLNRLTKEFIEPKGCDPITYCPQGYNKSWSGTGAELAALKNLDDSIILYWTGDDVNSPITQETVDYVSERTGQPICFWLNYPVNEHAKSGIFLGNITHYARDGVTGLRAAVSNPSRFGQSNKAALFQLASLFWNNSNYSEHSEEVWLGAYDYLQPEVKDEYLTIARNVANCPNSSRVTAGFPESEYIKENLEAVLEKVSNGESVKDLEDVEILQNEFDTILEAVEVFKEDCTNTALVSELTPWLNSLTDVTTACKSALECVVALENDDVAGAWSSFAAASKAFQSWDSYPTYTGDTNKALAGSKRLQPFAMKLINYAENILKPLLDSNYTDFTPTFYAKLGGTVKSHDSVAEKIFDGDTSTSAQWNVNQKKDDYYGVDLGRVMNVTDITILQGNTDTDHDYFHKAVLEYSEDGVNFTQIGERYDDQVSIAVDGLDIQARYVRLRLVETGTATKLDFWTHVREFTVNKTAPDGNRIYTNAAAYAKQPLTSKGKEWSVADLTDVTLEAGGYIGIKFVDLVNAASFTADGTGIEDLTLEASENGMVWTEVTDLSASQVLKYVRLVNKTADAITFDLVKLGVTTESSKINPKFLETNLTNGLQSGSWENLFDGDKSTYIWTNEGQTAGDYITFDLGTQVPLYDVTVYTYDGNPRFYNAEIQISKDNKTWETIAAVENDNSIMEVPCRYVKAEPDGTEARYLRIYITGNTGYYLRLHEIIINESVETVSDGTEKIQATFGNDIENAIDGNLSTLFTGTAGKEDSVTYKFTEGTRYNAISILQDPYKVSNAKVSVLTDKGYEELGKLDESAKKFTLDVEKDIYGMKLEFEQETEISIYEIYLDHAANTTDDLGEYVDPIVIEEDVLEPSNIALNKTVTVSGTSDGDKANVNDGSVDTKWDSDYIKGNNAKENSWVCIDLGRGSTSIFDTSKVSYFNKIYPTVSKIQISNDGENWITVSELTSEHNGATYPVVTTTFEPALTARYVRLFFEELNSAAAGNGVGVREWEITGITVNDVAVKNIQKFETQTVEQNTSLEELDLADFVTVTLTSKNSGDFKVQVPVSWNTEAYDASKAGSYELAGTLNLPESVTVTEAQKAVVTVVVKGEDLPVVKEDEVVRLSGTDRYATGIAVADQLKEVLGVEKFDTAIIATGKGYADALSGSYLAAVKNAPILLTNGKAANVAELHAYIKANVKAGATIYVLGGTAAVSKEAATIEGYTTKRLSGSNRYETNLKILEEAGLEGDDLLVATGKDFADSLSASAAARPILLVKPGTTLNDDQKVIAENFKNIYVIGGTGAVSVSVANELKAYGTVTRLSGAGRYETSVAVANAFFTEPETVVVAYGKNYPDGLCGGALAAALNAPLVLTKEGSEAAAAAYVAENGITSGYVLGGEGALPNDTVVTVFGLDSAAEIK